LAGLLAGLRGRRLQVVGLLNFFGGAGGGGGGQGGGEGQRDGEGDDLVNQKNSLLKRGEALCFVWGVT